MPSETTPEPNLPITGRCYCGARSIRADRAPQTVTYCHCDDCKRASGAPVAAFAAFDTGDVAFDPPLDRFASAAPGARRWFCPECGSPLASAYDYLPGQIYLPLGLLDQADALPPRLHAHAAHCYRWLKLDDDLPRETASSRERLKQARGK